MTDVAGPWSARSSTSSNAFVAPLASAGRPRRQVRPARVLLHTALLFACVVWMTPTIGLLVSSFRSSGDQATSGWWTAVSRPSDFTTDLYREAIDRNGVGTAFVNSLSIAIPATVLPILVAAFAAFAFSQFRFRGNETLLVVLTLLMIVPLQLTFIPLLRMASRLDLAGELPVVWLAHTGYGLPFAVFLLTTSFRQLPRDLMEAARIDGATMFQAFVRIVLPLSKPGLVSLAVFQFMWTWNDLLVALVFLGGNPDSAPITLKMNTLVGSLGQGTATLTAAAFISMIPPLIVFFTLQRYFVRGLLVGAVKG